MKRCHRCGAPWISEKKQPAVKDYCEPCSAYLHCCLNCRFYDKYAHNQCRVGTTEWVGDREGANFCDEFEFADRDAHGEKSGDRDQVKSALDGLFGGADGGRENTPGVDDFKKLFGD